MNPRFLDDLPLSEQRPLFELLQGLEERIGVRLRPDGLMEPLLSVSGLWFPGEESFESCMLLCYGEMPGAPGTV